MEKRKLSELNLIDDFLFEEALRRGEKGERFAKILLETILGKEFHSVKVVTQKNVRGISPQKHGIRLDAYVEAAGANEELTDVKVEAGIYDIEPSAYETKSEPKRARYYHSLIDARILKSGTDYKGLKNVVVIMILPYDPFKKNRMVYTVENTCKEEPEMEYMDGNKTIYLYTKGKAGNDRKALCDMLKYLETSTRENAVDDSLQEIQSLVEEIKRDEKVGVSYMKSWERDNYIKDEGKREGKKEILLQQVGKKLQKGKSIVQIAEELETEEAIIIEIIKFINEKQ